MRIMLDSKRFIQAQKKSHALRGILRLYSYLLYPLSIIGKLNAIPYFSSKSFPARCSKRKI